MQDNHKERCKPNIVIILADDMGYGDPSCYGGWIDTPCLNELACSGIMFTDFHSSGAVCSPTRAGLLTGRYQQRAGIHGVISAANHRHIGLKQDEITFSKLLKKSGYTTGLFGKWHLGYAKEFNPIYHGFDKFRGYVSGNIDYISHIDQTGIYDWWNNDELIEEPGYVTHLVTKHAVEFINENKDKPFCLYIAHEAPHYPYQGPNDDADRTVGGNFPIHGSRLDKKEAYREMVQEMDKGIGEVIDALKENGIENDTLVIFFSDNGAVIPLGSNAPFYGQKGQLWEGGHRVPAVMRWPGKIKPGTVSNEPVISIDIMPTILAVCGIEIPVGHKLDGIDISRILFDSVPLEERMLFWEHGNQQAVRKGRWKLLSPMPGSNSVGLFNILDDPGERNNLADQNPGLVEELMHELDHWTKEVNQIF